MSTNFTGNAPAEIVYIPEGVHQITPRVDGTAQTITVRMMPEAGPSVAAMLDGQLQRLRAGNVRPTLDFDHKREAASAIPTSFRYVPGKGLMLAVEWTAMGRAAIEGRSHSYFSPEFFINDDGSPGGLPERGPIGGLVNQPAFRTIQRIAASHAGESFGELLTREAQRLVEAGEARSFSDGMARVCAANPEWYEDYCREIHAGREGRHVQASTVPTSGSEALRLIEARASELQASGQEPSHDKALIMACSERPDLYAAYATSLHG